MFRHVALFRWHEGTDHDRVAEITAALRTLPTTIPSIRAYWVGPASSGTHDFAVVADFDDEAGWQAYDAHPDHDRVRSALIRPVEADRAVVRYEL
jgi:hypothetical protein